MPLEDYRSKRNFNATPEPAGRVRRGGRGRIFVVQKHDASRLHYDFRLLINDVLVSWAVPNGPSMNPTERRLALRTEDHPLEYSDFEGVIPKGQYGAGTVMVWDKGTYEPDDGIPLDVQLARGKIDVLLHGKKLRGGFTLVRTQKGLKASRAKERWLLVKRRDQYADSSFDIASPGLERSVLTGRTMKEIEQGRRSKRDMAVDRLRIRQDYGTSGRV